MNPHTHTIIAHWCDEQMKQKEKKKHSISSGFHKFDFHSILTIKGDNLFIFSFEYYNLFYYLFRPKTFTFPSQGQ